MGVDANRAHNAESANNVVRLRELAEAFNNDGQQALATRCWEAADEIERLRRLLAEIGGCCCSSGPRNIGGTRGDSERECLMSQVAITRTMAVLKLDQQRAGSPDEGGLFFTTQAEEPGYRPSVQLAPEMWRDLGNPEAITVALYPGDRQDLMEREDFPA